MSLKGHQLNIFTIDVEDYFQVAAFRKWIRYQEWEQYPCRIERNIDQVLEILDGFQVKATFFILGWIAEHYPGVVRKIHAEGHELASHGYAHQFVYAMSKEMFREDIRRSKHIVEEITGNEIHGYRAPNYSITNDSLWATDILLEQGFQYDSSIFPVRHPHYGLPSAERYPHYFRCPSGDTLLEFPPSTLHVLGCTIPIAGGAYLRHFPFFLIKRALQKINREGNPAVMYIHPWEIDPEQPRIVGIDLMTRIRHYGHLETTEQKLRELFRSFHYGTIRQVKLLMEQN